MRKNYSFPKINLALDILGVHESGYHLIHTVFYELSEPFDEIRIEATAGNKIEFESNDPRIRQSKNNSVCKAAMLFKRRFNIDAGLKIKLFKRIPVKSGLGGASSNAATALKILAAEFNVACCPDADRKLHHMPGCELHSIAREIGADCAFFLLGGTAEGGHFGEELKPLPALPDNIKIDVIQTGVEISTRWAYKNLDLSVCGKNVDRTASLIKALSDGDTHGILENLHNDFEEFVYGKFPALKNLKEMLQNSARENNQNCRVLLAGSGGVLVRIYS